MILLRTLGAIDLTASDGRTLDELLAQPKRLAVLAYLAAPAPGTWHRRDLLTSVFWPELDQGKARTALRNGLYILRRHLGTDVIRTRGDEDVALDPALLTTDAAEFCHEVQAGRQAEALARYRGPYLPGLFVRGSEGFEAWLERERQELAARATRVARELSLACEAAGNGEGAAEAQARLVELQPSDEAAVRRLMTLHERAGNRGRALAAYEQLAAHLRAELDAEPSAETLRQAVLRTRGPVRARPGSAPRAGTCDRASGCGSHVGRGPCPAADRSALVGGGHPRPRGARHGGAVPGGGGARAAPAAGAAAPAEPLRRQRQRRSRARPGRRAGAPSVRRAGTHAAPHLARRLAPGGSGLPPAPRHRLHGHPRPRGPAVPGRRLPARARRGGGPHHGGAGRGGHGRARPPRRGRRGEPARRGRGGAPAAAPATRGPAAGPRTGGARGVSPDTGRLEPADGAGGPVGGA
ncbi:MAG: hypothetical protein IPK12_01160 [Gemmatimonadetes bacterium]|nr:hypothetical protein [Gemmatimonadota bacterium]